MKEPRMRHLERLKLPDHKHVVLLKVYPPEDVLCHTMLRAVDLLLWLKPGKHLTSWTQVQRLAMG